MRRVSGLPLECGEDRAEAGLALAGDARLDYFDVRLRQQDRLRRGCLLEHGLRSGTGRRSQNNGNDLLGPGVDELRRQGGHQTG